MREPTTGDLIKPVTQESAPAGSILHMNPGFGLPFDSVITTVRAKSMSTHEIQRRTYQYPAFAKESKYYLGT